MKTGIQREIHLSDLGDIVKPSNDWRHIGPLVGVAFCLLVYYVTIFFQAMAGFYSPDRSGISDPCMPPPLPGPIT